MEDPKSVIHQDFDRSGQYEAGLKSLVRSLQWAFAFLLVVIIGMLVYFFTAGGYFAVEPQQAVIVLKFGKYENSYETGGHWFLPYPVNRFVTVRTNQQFMMVDFLPAPTLEGMSPEQSLEPGRDSYLLTGDANIIHASWQIGYQVTNPAKYYETLSTPPNPDSDDVQERDINGFMNGRGPQTLLRNLFRQAVISVTSSQKVDDILYTQQGRYSEEVLRLFTRLVQEADCGVEVENVSLNRVFPPSKTRAAFDEVAAANNTQSTLINQANEYMVQTENEMLARKAEILASAETYKMQVVSEVRAESSYFQTINREYAASPETVLMALYTSTLSEVLKSQEGKYILGTSTNGAGQKQVRIKLNPEPKNQVPAKAPAGEEK